MGCRVCRARKVKCDGRRLNGCANCERLGLECVGWTSPSTPTPGSSGLPGLPPRTPLTSTAPAAGSGSRKRTFRSCNQCRSAKTKCDGRRPTCLRCRVRSLPCIYRAGSEPSWTRVLARETSQTPSASAHEVSGEHSGLPTADTAGGSGVVTRNASVPSGQRPQINLSMQDSGRPVLPSGSPQGPDGPPSGDHETDELTLGPLAWLLSSKLPDSPTPLRELAEHYFANVHPLKCFAFVHKPSFMQQLDRGFNYDDDDNALLYMICAHGAKFYALDYSTNVQRVPSKAIHLAGNEWAKVAERMIFTNYGKISVPNLMAAVLLYDYQFRLGNYAHSLMISGFTTRMAHALQLNLEYSVVSRGGSPPPPTYTESRRRLMWACYILDVWTGSGVDQLTLLHESDIHIRLPCNERNFLLRIPCETDRLESYQSSPRTTESMGLAACYIRLVSLWKRIARYVKCLDTAKLPWLPDSEFATLHADLKAWRDGLSPSLDFSPEAVYIRLESSQLGALTLLHCTYHNAMCDLNRIAMPELFKLHNAFVFPPDQADFLDHLQLECLRHAQNMAVILAETARRGGRFLADSLLPSFAYNGSRVMLYYVARLLDPGRPHARSLMEETIRLVQSNNEVLRTMSAMIPLADPLYITAERWLRKVRTSFTRADATAHIGPRDPSDVNETEWSESRPGSPIQPTPDHILNPLSLYRLARKAVSETHSAAVPWSASPPSQVVTPTARAAADEAVSTPLVSSVPPPLATASGVPMRSEGGGIPAVPEGALDLDELQYYLTWGLDGGTTAAEASMADGTADGSALAAWLGAGDRREAGRDFGG
ncbi:hypothetical protein VTK73DRAFT_4444 [Phialemonium thermophilum]|uniref:Zn(2)-C6 fungal-type domain-containing protein n=1 Tax=Phialemonium thermophilum TaxID=223376 RepID=A0ABR3WTN7_9PEZI